MKLPNSHSQQKLRAATASRRAAQPHALDEQEEEPTMSLGAAFIVVLLLHVVAVGGVYGFNSVKAHHPAAFQDPVAKTETVVAKAPPAKPAPAAPAVVATKAPESAAPALEPVKKPALATTAAVGDAKATPKDSGEFYVVAKRDNLLSIAKKRHVAYADLVKLNKIEDPAKLKIGQKLRIPAKAKTASN